MSHTIFLHSKEQIVEDLSVGRGNLWRTGLHGIGHSTLSCMSCILPYFGDFFYSILFCSTLTWPHFSHVMHAIFLSFYDVIILNFTELVIRNAQHYACELTITFHHDISARFIPHGFTLLYTYSSDFLILSIVLTTYNHAKKMEIVYNKSITRIDISIGFLTGTHFTEVQHFTFIRIASTDITAV